MVWSGIPVRVPDQTAHLDRPYDSIAITTEDIDATSTNPNELSFRQTSNQKVIVVAGRIPKGKGSNRALSCYTLPIPSLPRLRPTGMRGRYHL